MRLTRCAIAILLASLLSAPQAYACSKFSLPIPPGDSDAYFTGTATPDTLLAGPGVVAYGLGGGHYGRADGRPIHGQVIRVDRIGGPAAARLPGDVREVVVVPWDYDAACEPLAWGRSARWVPAGNQGLYVASLRAAEHWADGRPTFDLHNPGHLPYTGTRRIPEMSRGIPIAFLLSPDQVFDLYEAAPAAAEIAREKSRALEPLRAWVKAHPEIAARPPAEWLLQGVLHAVGGAELREADHPILGTWRFTLRMPGGSSHTFYARTESPPLGRWTPTRTRPSRPPGDLRHYPAEGYTVGLAVARQPEDLPEAIRGLRSYAPGFLVVLAAADSTGEDEIRWPGRIESSLLQAALPGDPRVERAAAEMSARFSSRYRQGLPQETPARFVRGADGVLRVSHSFPLGGGEDVVLEGEQVSRAVVQW